MVAINKLELFVELRSSTQPGVGIDVGDIYVRLDPSGLTLQLVDPAVLSLLGISVSAGASSVGRLAILDATGKFDISFIPVGAGVGDVIGPAGALDNSICLFNGITGKLIKDSVALGAVGQVLASNGAGLPPSFQTVTLTPFYISPLQAIVLGGGIALLHGLPAAPAFCWFEFQNVIAQAGYAVGDRINAMAVHTKSGANSQGPFVSIRPTATTLNVRYSTGSPGALNSGTGAFTTLTPANWQVRFYATT